MQLQVIDARLMQKAFLAGAKGLEAKKEWINELNVFPVPDGDTGTNMTMTIMAAAKDVAAMEEPTMEGLAKAISGGSLRGARGNSGVILSQLFRGFTKEIKTAEAVDVKTLARAFERASETAYKAVMKPKEGTILTVAKGMAEKAMELAEQTDDILAFAEQVAAYGDQVLAQTPEMLPVLKQAGVVDSGGQGLMQVIKGALEGLHGKEVDLAVPASQAPRTEAGSYGAAAGRGELDTADIRFGYCTEFIINVEHPYDEKMEQEFKGYLESIGDSIVVVSDEDVVKVHVHTNDPGLAIQKALTYGSLSRMKIDNMREEHQERLIQNAEQVELDRLAFNFTSTQVNYAKEYQDFSDARLTADSQTAISGELHALGNYYFNNWLWSNALELNYGKTRIRPVEGETLTNEHADKIAFTTGYTQRLWRVDSVLGGFEAGPFANIGYETEFTRLDNAPRYRVYRGMLGVKIFDGDYIKDFYSYLL